MRAQVTPSKRKVLSNLIAQGNVTPVQKFVDRYTNIPQSAIKEANIALNYGVMARESSHQLKNRERIEAILEKTQPLTKRLVGLFGFGGNRINRTRTHKRKTKKNIQIPPLLAEVGIDIAQAVAVGGKRRKTRRNK
jgi:hypothetical protein